MRLIAHNLRKTKHTLASGFTLVETLVAVSILLIAVVGPIGLIGDATHKIFYSKDQMIAVNLAQEGIEAVRHARDTNLLAGASWDTNFTPGNYVVDVSQVNPLIVCAGSCDQVVYISGGIYKQPAGGTPTQYSRIVNTAAVASNADERKVTSTVTWKTGGDTGTISVSEDIYKLLP